MAGIFTYCQLEAAEEFSGRLLGNKLGETAACRTQEQWFVLQQINSSLAALTLQPSPLRGLQAVTPRQQELEERAWHPGGETATAEKTSSPAKSCETRVRGQPLREPLLFPTSILQV